MEPKDINFAAMPQTAINVVTKPAEFFQGMPKTGGFLEPLVFAVIMGFIAGIIQAILSFIGLGHAGGYGGGMMAGFGAIIFVPIAIAIGSFIGAAILFVIWKLMGSQENYETAYRCGAYLTSLAPLIAVIGVIPYAGGLVNMAIYVFYLVAASIHVHNIPSQKAWLVFGIIGVIFALIGVFAEYKVRNMASSMDKWRQTGEEFRKSARDMEKSTEEMRKQAEEMAKQLKEQAEEAKRQVERNQ
ncbi:MAG: YIP1 family protein [Smithella sp.]